MYKPWVNQILSCTNRNRRVNFLAPYSNPQTSGIPKCFAKPCWFPAYFDVLIPRRTFLLQSSHFRVKFTQFFTVFTGFPAPMIGPGWLGPCSGQSVTWVCVFVCARAPGPLARARPCVCVFVFVRVRVREDACTGKGRCVWLGVRKGKWGAGAGARGVGWALASLRGEKPVSETEELAGHL